MALGLEYRGTYTSKTGNTYTWDLHVEGGSGTATPITESGQGFLRTTWSRDEDHEWSPIFSSETILTIFDASAGVYDALVQTLSSNLRRGSILYIKDSGDNVVWQGYGMPEGLTKAEEGAGELSIAFTDGLGQLEDVPFVSDIDDLTPYTGRATFVSVLATVLSKTGFTLPFYVASDMYPRHATTQLLATDCPLENTYVDRYRYRNKTEEEEDTKYISTMEVLRDILRRWGCYICQSGGQWHIIQSDLLMGASYRRWYYDSNGTPAVTAGNAPEVYEDVTPRVTPVSETVERSPGTISALSPYDAVSVDYQHGLIELLHDPEFKTVIPDQTKGTNPYRWISTGVTSLRMTSKGVSAVVPRIAISSVPTTQGTGVGSWDKVVQDNTGTSGYFTALSPSLLDAGTQIVATGEFIPVKDDADATAVAHNSRYALAQVEIYDGTNRYYLTPAGAWTGTVNWIPGNAGGEGNTVFTIGKAISGSDALPATSAAWQMWIRLGPVLELSSYFGSGGAANTVDEIHWTNGSLDLVLADGTFNHERTVTTNYVGDNSSGRVSPRVLEWLVHTGDGPVSGIDASITMDLNGTDITSDWEEGAITGSASGDSMSQLLSRMILRSVRNPREVHNASYFSPPSALDPVSPLYRGGSAYAPTSITRDWFDETYSGSWVKLRQNAFTDDFETSLIGAVAATGFGGSSDRAGFISSQMARSFFSAMSRRIAVTDAVIAAGATTTISVEEITEALLESGDSIVLVAPNLDYYELAVAADQLVGDTSITIASYTFPEEIPYPASVYFTEDKLLTLARLGEQGFAITVKGDNIGIANEDKDAEGVTSLAVANWIASVPSGSTVYVVDDDGTEQALVLSAVAPRGSTSISFAAKDLDLTTGAAIRAENAVSRTEFKQNADSITLAAARLDALIGTAAVAEVRDDGTAYYSRILGGLIYSGNRTTVPCTPTRKRLRAGSQLAIGATEAGTHSVTVSTDTDVGATTIPIVLSPTHLPVGYPIIHDPVEIAAKVLIEPTEIRDIVKGLAQGRAVGVLSADALIAGNNHTSFSVNALPNAVKDNQPLLLTNQNGDTQAVQTNGAASAAATSITVDSVALAYDFPAGSTLAYTDAEAQAQITTNAAEIDLRVTAAGVVNAVNVSTEGIKINANRITIGGSIATGDSLTSDGYVTESGGWSISGNDDFEMIVGSGMRFTSSVFEIDTNNATGIEFVDGFGGTTEATVEWIDLISAVLISGVDGTSFGLWSSGAHMDPGTGTGAFSDIRGEVSVASSGDKLGFFGATRQTKQAITGARNDPEAALANLLNKLAYIGLITDSTTAT